MEEHAAQLGQAPCAFVGDLGGGRDRITGVEARASVKRTFGNGLVALQQACLPLREDYLLRGYWFLLHPAQCSVKPKSGLVSNVNEARSLPELRGAPSCAKFRAGAAPRSHAPHA